MLSEHAQLDQELARLATSLCARDHMLACLQLAEFALKLDHYIRIEERALLHCEDLEAIHREHVRLRELVGTLASALDDADAQRGLKIIGSLRSVLLLHGAKEDLLIARTIH